MEGWGQKVNERNTNIYIVLCGEDCEGGVIEAVFSDEMDATNYLAEHWPSWEEVSPHERRRGCTFACVEEWGVV